MNNKNIIVTQSEQAHAHQTIITEELHHRIIPTGNCFVGKYIDIIVFPFAIWEIKILTITIITISKYRKNYINELFINVKALRR
jgi:hypothetical protein